LTQLIAQAKIPLDDQHFPMGILMDLTAVFLKVPEGYVAFVEELPGANTQGETLAEARENLQESVALILQANREAVAKAVAGQSITRERLVVAAP